MIHTAQRPSWDCEACGRAWPCAPARAELVTQYGPGTALAMLGWGFLEEAVRDLPSGPPRELFDRFIGWTR